MVENYYDLIYYESEDPARFFQTSINDYGDESLNQTLDPNFKGAILKTYNEILDKNLENFPNYSYRTMLKPFVSAPTVFFFRKNFYLIDAINKHIVALQSAGLIEYWTYKEQYHESRLKVRNWHPSPIKLEINHLMIAFHILAVGLALALVSFVAESFICRPRTKNDEGD